MSYQNPKTNWISADVPLSSDFNRIENNTKHLKETSDAHIGSTGASHGAATTAANGFMSSEDKSKLNGIQTGAQVNTVTSVATKTGAVTLDKDDVGLGDVDNVKQAPHTHVGATGDAHGVATTEENGFMSSGDKSKLDSFTAHNVHSLGPFTSSLSNYNLPANTYRVIVSLHNTSTSSQSNRTVTLANASAVEYTYWFNNSYTHVTDFTLGECSTIGSVPNRRAYIDITKVGNILVANGYIVRVTSSSGVRAPAAGTASHSGTSLTQISVPAASDAPISILAFTR